MVIRIEITATDANELANEVNLLANVLGGGQRVEVSKPDLTITRTVSEAPAAPAAPAKKAKKTDKVEPAAEEKVKENLFQKMNRESEEKAASEDARPYTVYKANGDKFSDYKTAESAFERLSEEIKTCATVDELNAQTSYNVEAVGALAEAMQDAFNELVDNKYNELEEGEGDPAEEKVTSEVAYAAVEDFVKKKGLISAKKIFSDFNAKKFSDLKAEQYPKLVKALKAAA